MYAVLRPIYRPTGETNFYNEAVYAVQWRRVGTAYDMEDAKERFGGCPVLEPEGFVPPPPKQPRGDAVRRFGSMARRELEAA